jgi:serine/threonine protein phosphatase PrpC|eukprot:COSAG01_NODE_366_length_18064_cov_35.830615_11_plen_410_part_00
MGGGASKAKKSKVKALTGADFGSDPLPSVAEMAARSRGGAGGATPAVIAPLFTEEPGGGGGGGRTTTPVLPETYSASLHESPPDDDFASVETHGRAPPTQQGTPPSFVHKRSSGWGASAAGGPTSQGVGGDGWCAGESTHIGGRKENQDTSFGVSLPGGVWAGGVFDGHGAEGRAAACYARDSVRRHLSERGAELWTEAAAASALRAAFAAAHAGMGMAADCTYSGTTAVVCVVLPGSITVAWVGDSRAVVGPRDGSGCTGLTEDHRPEVPSERERIEGAGGLVRRSNGSGPMRVYGGAGGAVGLMLTRSLGDLEMHGYGVSAEPQISTHSLSAGDELLLMGSDGVFDAMDNGGAIRRAGAGFRAKGTQDEAAVVAAATSVVEEAADWWARHPGSDNITAVVLSPLSSA